MDVENRIDDILDNPQRFKALKDLVVYLKGGEESLDAMARKTAAKIITQWTPGKEYHQTNLSPAIYFVLLRDDYLLYEQIWTISKVFAKAFIMISAIYIGRDKTPKTRKGHHWGLLSDTTDFDQFFSVHRSSNGQLFWFYFTVRDYYLTRMIFCLILPNTA